MRIRSRRCCAFGASAVYPWLALRSRRAAMAGRAGLTPDQAAGAAIVRRSSTGC